MESNLREQERQRVLKEYGEVGLRELERELYFESEEYKEQRRKEREKEEEALIKKYGEKGLKKMRIEWAEESKREAEESKAREYKNNVKAWLELVLKTIILFPFGSLRIFNCFDSNYHFRYTPVKNKILYIGAVFGIFFLLKREILPLGRFEIVFMITFFLGLIWFLFVALVFVYFSVSYKIQSTTSNLFKFIAKKKLK